MISKNPGHFIFDVDGTLTPSRGKMDYGFQQEFMRFQLLNKTYLVTGSDFPKTLEQVGYQIIFSCVNTFHCSGNEGREQGKVFYHNEWLPDNDLILALNIILKRSEFPVATGKHIEQRSGSLNFSIVGRNATKEQRDDYKKWDIKTSERKRIVESLLGKYGDKYEFQIGGETGIDVMPKGKDKAQILTHINLNNEPVYFFGDAIRKYGNDDSLSIAAAAASPESHIFEVRDWTQTREFLKNFYGK